MQLEDKFHVSSGMVSDKPVEDLITFIKEEGRATIDSSNSEQKIKYRIQKDSKESTVPLRVSLDKGTDVIAYFLRGDGLELTLQNYDNRYPQRSDTIGSPLLGSCGVECIVKFNGSYEDAKIVDTVKRSVIDFYR